MKLQFSESDSEKLKELLGKEFIDHADKMVKQSRRMTFIILSAFIGLLVYLMMKDFPQWILLFLKELM